MRSLLLKCLVVLVSLALVSGNAHAALSLDDVHAGPCAGEHDHHTIAAGRPDAAHHHDAAHHQDKAHGSCCCECLGCTAAVDLVQGPLLMRAAVALNVRFEQRSARRTGQALDPELDPPRPAALI